MKFNLLTGIQEIKLAIPVKFDLSRHYFCLLRSYSISFLLSLLAMFFSNFKIMK